MSIITDTTVYDGAPADTEGRQERELRTYRLLEQLNIPFRRLDHGAAMTMEDCDGIDALLDFIYFFCRTTKNSAQLSFPNRSAQHGSLLRKRNSWSNIWISIPALSASSD